MAQVRGTFAALPMRLKGRRLGLDQTPAVDVSGVKPGTSMKRVGSVAPAAPGRGLPEPGRGTDQPGRTGMRPMVPAPIPRTPTSTTTGAPQTESANPLSGDGNAVPGGTTVPVAPALPVMNPGKAFGASSRGANAAVPAGQDLAAPDDDGDEGAPADAAPGHTGGTGALQRSFSNPTSASIYADYVKRLGMGDGAPVAQPRKPGLRAKVPAPLSPA